MTRTVIFILLLGVPFLGNVPGLRAQRMLSLEEAQQRAHDHAEEVKIARLEVEHAERGVDIARTQRLPRLDLTASYTHISETGGIDLAIPGLISRSIRFGDGNVYESAITASVPLFTGFRLETGQRMQEAQVAITGAQLKGTETSLHNRVAIAYRQAQLALRSRRIYEEQLQYLGAQLDLLKKLQAQGQILPYDTLLLSTRMSALRVERASAHSAYRNARLTVADFGDLDPDFDVSSDVSVTSTLPIEDEEALLQAALLQRSDLAVLREMKALGDQRVRAEKAAYLPALSAFASYRYGKPGVDQVSNAWMNYYTAGLALQWNLWSWGGDRGRVDQQEIQRQETDLRYARLERQLRTNIRSLRNDLGVLAETRAMLDDQVRQESVKRDLLQARLSQGLATATELVDAETARTTALLRREQSDIQYLIKLTELANVIGKDI
ncbi:MAG: TolC family protein [Bacteroidetes bacterium]|nr:TolC family protein [Bacteroidota bacterium]